MNKILPAIVSVLLTFGLNAQETIIPITTNDNVILLQTSREGRLSTVYFGVPLQNKDEFSNVSKAYNLRDNNAGIYNATYTTAGTWNLVEPAIQVLHADGNTSLELKYVSHQQKQTVNGSTLTSILLEDA